ncbi:MAG: multicopper oxidase family protein [Pseudomonadota bacterium]
MTSITRRTLLQGAAGAAALTGLPLPSMAGEATPLVARSGTAQLTPEGYPPTAIWGYDGAVPGPTIRVPQGARLTRAFSNALPQPSSVHWHGIRITNAMDGVAYLTQEPVPTDATFLYDFSVPDAGTYWYHPHNRTWEQMARGLYGALIVEEASGAPDVDMDEVLLIDDWRLDRDGQIAAGFGNLHDWSHGGRIGNWITVNGEAAWGRTVPRHARLRLRLVNAANARVFDLGAQGLTGWVVALDGMPLDAPHPLEQVTLAPAQRADVIVDVTAEAGGEAFLFSRERDGGYALATFQVESPKRAAARPTPAPLPANPVAALGPLDTARRATLTMEGGAMGRMRGATLNGRSVSAREMAQQGKVWALNGAADMPDAPLLDVTRGETVRITIVNDTNWPHGMHLHGHHFRQIDAAGGPGPLRDTILLNRGESAEIAFVADNPGDWLLHCHMLEHAAGGMTTWLRVA